MDFRLKFIGFVSPAQRDLIASALEKSEAEYIQYVDHRAAISYMLDSSALLLIIPDHVSSRSIITGKLFEYIAAGKPVICIGPADGDAANILEETGHGKTFNYGDSGGISDYLMLLSSNPGINEKVSPSIYSRENLVKRVIELLH
jgi:glycosyltransferase involved in cell wall biosynthesis